LTLDPVTPTTLLTQVEDVSECLTTPECIFHFGTLVDVCPDICEDSSQRASDAAFLGCFVQSVESMFTGGTGCAWSQPTYIGEEEATAFLAMLSRKYLVLISVSGTLRWDHLFAVSEKHVCTG
jgi:hypothetical protein